LGILKRTHYTDQLSESISGTVILSGWVHDIKDLAKFRFIWLRDNKGIVQITIPRDRLPQLIESTNSLGREDVISVEGELVKKRVARVGQEIIPINVELVSKSVAPLPIEIAGRQETELDKRLDWRPLDLRRPSNVAIFKIQAKIIEAMENHLRDKGFLQVNTPCIIGGASEGGADIFKTDYFGDEAYLRQDPQLHRQLLMIAGFDKIFDIGPNWRAEPSHTPRHLCEHRGCAVELSFISDERDVIRVEEELVVAAIKSVSENCKAELRLLGKEVTIPQPPFPELRFPQIYDILKKFGKDIPFGEDYDRESELILARYVKEKFKSDFFFVNRFPSKVKPFYVMQVDDEPQWARSVDLIFKGLEQSSGGQREHRYEKIIERLDAKGISRESMKWFTEPFRYGAPPHGGFCIGIERFTMQLLDIQNIREATLFPRTPERLFP
jgi:aspartyl-tRNA synthetase